MNRIIVYLLFISCCIVVNATNTKQISICFNEKDFSFINDSNEQIQIISHNVQAFYENDSEIPALPFVVVNVLIGDNYQYKDFTYSQDYKIVLSNVNLAHNPLLRIGNDTSRIKKCISNYKLSLYPDSIVSYMKTNIVDGYRYLSFKVWPYIYDAKLKTLIFNKNIYMEINLDQNKKKSATIEEYKGKTMRDAVKNLIINKEDINSLYPISNSGLTRTTNTNIPFDYIIITRDSLKSSFGPLAKWKTVKGIRTKIITIEEIDSNYNKPTPQLRIKQCLQDYYNNHGMQYALLGGDETIVPVQYCRAQNGNKDILMPTDLFYCNFNNPFDWNANGNDSIGEDEDNVNLAPEIFLTRTAIRTSQQANIFVTKILDYEQNPPVENWNNNILMCGSHLTENLDSEAFDKGETIFSESISPYWDGGRMRFYDYNTDIDFDMSNYTSFNLQKAFSTGFPFIDVIGHGNEYCWRIGDGYYDYPYYNIQAQQLHNNHPTIITTSSCTTNGFDKYEPCLSEAFIRNPNSGVVAYLGCSDESIVFMGPTLGPAESYCAEFYKKLFSDDTSYCNYGRIVANIKLQNVPVADFFEAYRWTIFGMNPIGDPEMPIYQSTPKRFDNVDLMIYNNNLYLTLLTENNYEVTITGKNMDGSDYYLHTGTDEIIQGIPNQATICITKPGYVPYVCYRDGDNIYIQNQTFTGRQIISGTNTIIGNNVSDIVNNKGVVIKSGTTEILMDNTTTIRNDFEVIKGATLTISKE